MLFFGKLNKGRKGRLKYEGVMYRDAGLQRHLNNTKEMENYQMSKHRSIKTGGKLLI